MSELLGTFSIGSLRQSALLRGAASAFDLTGNTRRQYDFSPTPAEADLKALRADWEATGDDMRAALNEAAAERLAQ